jgi:hypothetical protein
MPLRDHFRPPLWATQPGSLYSLWAAALIRGLYHELPPNFVAEPRSRWGGSVETDVATFMGFAQRPALRAEEGSGGSLAPGGAPPRPTLAVASDLLSLDEYQVRVYHRAGGRHLVAVVEFVTPAHKDRPGHRRAFLARCAAMLQARISVAIVDVVTTLPSDLHGELMALFGQDDPSPSGGPAPLRAVSYRGVRRDDGWVLEAWAHPLGLGRPLPTQPLWLGEDLAVPLALEPIYEETCRILRIP